ncbi:MAG: HAD-IA family hydrolase [Planctomycetes bacterium]|nr:HAD-IA family hydrolase [Planctomycetota bacterium]
MSTRSLELVTLDAGGTLLGERSSRGDMYAAAARNAGLPVTGKEMADLMREVHDRLPRELHGAWRYQLEWFSALIHRVFVGELGLAPDRLPGIEEALFADFRDPSSFKVLPGAFELQGVLARSGVRMAVISNWSEDLHALLSGLGLSERLEFTLTSAEERCEKPAPEIFHRALERAGVSPENALHIGDSPREDYDGARAVGMDALLVGPDDGGGRRRASDLIEASRKISEHLL